MSDLFSDRAPARPSDPDTSRKAADTVTPDLPTIRARVEAFALDAGATGFIDEDLQAIDPDAPESSYRKRRTELTQANIILDARTRRGNSHGDECVVWVHRDYVVGPPPVIKAAPPAGSADKAEGRATADKMAGWAVSMKKEGRAMFANELAEAAELMKRLSA